MLLSRRVMIFLSTEKSLEIAAAAMKRGAFIRHRLARREAGPVEARGACWRKVIRFSRPQLGPRGCAAAPRGGIVVVGVIAE